MNKYPSQANLLSSIQQAVIEISKITLDESLIKSLVKIDDNIWSILDCTEEDELIIKSGNVR